MKRFAMIFLLGICALSAGAYDVQATSVRLLSLVEMTELSDRVFWGQCVSVVPVVETRLGLPVLEYSFRVDEAVKGVDQGEIVVFRQVRAVTSGGAIHGMPGFRKGDRVMLFLHGESELGLTSPVGLDQGIFKAHRTQAGELRLVNGLQNSNLLRGVRETELQELGLTADEKRLIEARDGIPLAEFCDLLERVDRHLAGKGKGIQ